MKVKQREVPLDQWESYKRFAKVISDDWSAWIELYTAGATGAVGSGTSSAQPDPEFMEKAQQAFEALQRNDTTTAEELTRALLAKDPQARGLHALLGYVYARRNNSSAAIEEFRKEEELHPDNTEAYKTLASYYIFQKEDAKAEEQFRKWLAVDPKNYDATLGLSEILNRTKKHADVVAFWEKAYELMPESSNVRFSLALAYLKNNQLDKGMPLIEKELATETKPMTFNNIAYVLADDNLFLDKAKEWGDKALQGLEAESPKPDSEEAALTNTRDLAAAWDTVGWIYFKRGEFARAEAYLRAAFALSQSAVVGDHLAQLFERQGKRQEAAHYYLLAMAVPDRSDCLQSRRRPSS
jgi:Tfp pilus assembly protein PilF